MPGIPRPGFGLDDLSAGINVVHGPNESGKTTLAHAIESLLWPEESAPEAAAIEGRLRDEDNEWRLEVEASFHRQSTTKGDDDLSTILSSPQGRDRYYIALHELLRKSERGHDFAREIRNETAGGIDLEEATDGLGYRTKPHNRKLTEHQDVPERKEDYEKAFRNARELREEERRLDDLKKKLEEAKGAESRIRLIDKAIEVRKAKETFNEEEAKVNDYPSELENFTDRDVERLEELEEEKGNWEDEVGKAEGLLKDAKTKITDADLPEGGLPEDFLGTLETRVTKLDNLSDQVSTLETEKTGTEQNRDEAWERIDGAGTPEDLEAIDIDAIGELESFAIESEKIRSAENTWEAVKDWIGEPDPPGSPEELQRGVNLLQRWLQEPATEPPSAEGTADSRWITYLSVISLAASGGALGYLVHVAGYVLILVAGVLAFLAWRHKPSSARGTGAEPRRRGYARDFETETELTPPDRWESDSVRDRLSELQDDLASAKLEKGRQQTRESLAPDLKELKEKREAVTERREAIEDEVRVVPELEDRGLTWFLEQVRTWQDAADQVSRYEGKLSDLRTKRAQALRKINEDLEAHGFRTVDDNKEAENRLEALRKRQTKREQGLKEKRKAEKRLEKARRRVSEQEDKIKEHYRARDLEPGNRSRLVSLASQHSEYETCLEERRDAKRELKKASEQLEDHPLYEPSEELETLPIEELESRKENAEETASTREKISDRISRIKERIEQAKRSHDVEEALSAYENAREALAERRNEDYHALVGDLLTQHVYEVTRRHDRPGVLERAGELFAEITNFRYELDLDPSQDPPVFIARDTTDRIEKSLDELSDGTRLQLLLAVRVAFVEEQEMGAKAPLVLDEALANSDDLRAQAIIDAVVEIARRGRQVFYLTAQGDEVARWRSVLEDIEEGVRWEEHDLSQVRDLDRPGLSVPSPDQLPDIKTPQLPDPEGLGHGEYGEALELGGLDLRAPVSRAHLWYLIMDVDALHSILQTGIEKWGQLETLLDRQGPLALESHFASAPDEAAQHLRARAAGLEALSSGWRVGRGKPVDRAALEETDGVRETFIEEVSEINEEVDGEAERLLRRIDEDVKGFYQSKLEELESFLLEEGYLDDRDRLDAEDLRARVLAELQGTFGEEASQEADGLLKRVIGGPGGKLQTAGEAPTEPNPS